ncbi:hypothetical protein PGT21_004993 [Puccinia graminis f. sp. tritici]|uniref:RRM domain-containing protein n=1 Tax=Puccinia graminis f. sp. tritici TaxID=56615 RepID=A0A5B0PLP1_PUCGR|nr:hypothetical protein PGT21_004993 [Puccinia graminis f. sp. tritici]KAA1102515.1 hypothetical protein PGTUg99_004950 [Puccinia graminis f. sp. tritici]
MPLIDRIMPAAQQTTKINIANLAEGTSLADVMTSFSQFGKIMRCSLKQHYDGQDTSVSATIEFLSYTSAVSAVEELDGATADGLCLHVKLVRVVRPPVHIATKEDSTKQEVQDESPLLHRISKRPRA